jgi:UMF1 family MFS transporter
MLQIKNQPKVVAEQPSSRKELVGWAMYDAANSTFATVIVTTVYNAYFVRIIAGSKLGADTATLLLGLATSIASLLIVFSAPVLGAITDAMRIRKKILLIATIVCVAATALLSTVPPGEYIGAMALLIVASVAYGTGEDLVAAFLPEIAERSKIGFVSAIGWAAGYMGGLGALVISLVYVLWAQHHGMTQTQYVPVVTLICAGLFALASVPTFLWVRERGHKQPGVSIKNVSTVAVQRLGETFHHARQYQDLFRFLVALFVFGCGSTTVIQLACVYADQTLHFTPQDAILMMCVVHITSALGALFFGKIQDRIGSIKTLFICALLWIATVVVAYLAVEKWQFWIAANIVGAAVGGTGSVSRALVGTMSPRERTGEFLGLWGMAIKFATAVGPLTFGIATKLSGNNFRIALLTTLFFILAGIALAWRVDEKRGMRAADEETAQELALLGKNSNS